MFEPMLQGLPSWEMTDAAWDEIICRDPGPFPDPEPEDSRFADPWFDGDVAIDPAARSDTAIIDAITALQRDIDRAGARQTRLLAEFTNRRLDPAPKNAAPDRRPTFDRWAPDEIALALSLSRVTALVKLHQAVQLRDVLPAVLDAWEAGLLDVLKVLAICDACLRVPAELAPAVAGRVLPRASGQTRAQLKASLKKAVIAVDPDGANERNREAEKKRRVVLDPEEDGMATLRAYLSAPQAMTAYGWLSALARGLGQDDPRSMDERRADMLAALLTGNLTITPPDNSATGTGTGETVTADSSTADSSSNDTGTADSSDTTNTPSGLSGSDNEHADNQAAASENTTGEPAAENTDAESHETGLAEQTEESTPPPPAPRGPRGMPEPVPGKPLVHVLVPITTLYGADQQPAELVGYGPIPAALARDIAADAIWKRLVTDPLSGALLDHGRSTYRPPAATADFVRARDVHCRFPTCRRRALDSELDHTEAWTADDGETCDENLYDACPHHHHLKHDAPGWTVSQDPDGIITWTTPTGHRHSTAPYDYRPEPDLPTPAKTAASKPEQPWPDLSDRFTRHHDPDAPDDAPF